MSKDKTQKQEEDKILELENSWKRALADYQNLQKRFIEEKDAYVRYANTSLLLRVLPILDNLYLISMHSQDEGIVMIIKEFEKILQEEGLVEVEALGKDFESESMDAIEMVDGEEGKIVEVIQKGYLFKNKILRPAKVKVGQKKEEK